MNEFQMVIMGSSSLVRKVLRAHPAIDVALHYLIDLSSPSEVTGYVHRNNDR